jgi:hypothetical protein
MKRTVAVGALVLLLVLVVGVVGVAKKPAFVGVEEQINVLHGWPDVIYSDQASWVSHGAIGGYYPGMQPDFKDETGDRSAVNGGVVKFELFINGVPVKLRVQKVVIPGDEPGTSQRRQLYYVQFEPFHFEPGEYVFTGIWSGTNPNSAWGHGPTLIRTHTLTVLEP